MGEFALRASDLGYNYIGSCCGSVAAHVREMAKASARRPLTTRVATKTGIAQSGYELHRTKDQ